tara:strand:+ start:14657 stop:15499 length:843 start_codon:yes stop_codon:yes gene_type:complete
MGVDTGALYQKLSASSIRAALAEQDLAKLCNRLREIVPDVTDHYTQSFDQVAFERYWETKMRGLHAFQTSCALDAMAHLDRQGLTIVDLGDSSGNHAAYLRALAPEGTVSRVVSVNMDEAAIDKINAKGGEAVLARVEDFSFDGVRPDLLMSFETLEHILDPIGFLRSLAVADTAEHIVLSVPFRRKSRFGGALMRRSPKDLPAQITPEETHIFELSPVDWELLARFAGFRKIFARVYLQYPKRSPLRVTAPLWRRLDFEGFLVLFLERDNRLADCYTGW